MAASSSAELVAAIDGFQAGLTSEQNAQLLAQSQKPDATSVITFMTQIDNENATRRQRGVSSRLFRMLESVQGFSGIVDTFVSSHPAIAALVWGSVKFVIYAANNITSFFEKLSECFLRLGRYCPRYSEYQALFVDSTRLQKSLSSFYATVINFCAGAYQNIQNPGMTLTKALWRPFEKEFGDFENKLRKQNEEVREEIQLAAEQAAGKERKAAADHRKNEVFFRSKATKDAQERSLLKKELKARVKRRELLDRLFSHDYLGALRRKRKKRYGQTSSWLSESKAFKDWLEDADPSTLWLSGILGSGKSTVTAAVIENLLSHPRKGQNHISFFFCEYDNISSLDARTILGTLLRQCLSESDMSDLIERRLKELLEGMFPDVRDLEPLLQDVTATPGTTIFVIDGFDECRKNDRMIVLKTLQRLMSSSQSIVKIFLSSRDDIIGDIDRVFTTCHQVVMDCKETHADILTFVKDMIDDKLLNGDLEVGDIRLKQDILDTLAKGANGMFLWVAFQIEDLCRQKCDADIRNTLQTLPRDLTQTYNRILTRIVKERNDEIVKKIFRWIAAAKRPLLLDELREAIAIEPGDPYLRKDRLVNNANNIISWCGSLAMLQEEDSVVQFAHHSVKQFLLSGHYDVVTEPFHFQLPDVDRAAGEICVTYLHFKDFNGQVIRLPRQKPSVQPKDFATNTMVNSQNRVARYGTKFVKVFINKTRPTPFDIMEHLSKTSGKNHTGNSIGYPLLPYVKQFWLSHTAELLPLHTPTWELWKELVDGEHHLAVKPWTQKENIEWHIMDYIVKENHFALINWIENLLQFHGLTNLKPSELLIHASRQGNARVVQYLAGVTEGGRGRRLPAKVDVNIVLKSSGQTALVTAAECGHIEVVNVLLMAKADVNAISAKGPRTALQAAAGSGHIEVVKALLTANADVTILDQYGEDILQAATEGGHTEVVKMLWKAINLINASIITSKTLRKAVEAGHTAMLNMLLTLNVDINPGYCPPTSLLIIGAERGQLEMVKILLTANVDVNGLTRWTALSAAAYHGHVGVVKTLLVAKADVDLEDHFSRTPLHRAAAEGHIEVVKTLLTAKANVNLEDYQNRTALHEAATRGHIEVVKTLLAAKADVNHEDYQNRTALHGAAKEGHIEVIKTLLAAKADVNLESYFHRTALHESATRGHIEVAKTLLAAKTVHNLKDCDGRTALHEAAQGGHIEVVKSLLAANADVNADANGYGLTALCAAAEEGRLEMVEILLTAHTDVNTKYNVQRALRAAAGSGHMEVVKALSAANTDVNAATSGRYDGPTARRAAAKKSHLEEI